MAIRRTIDDVRRARDADDPALIDLVVALAAAPDPSPDAPARDGALTFDRVLAELRSAEFARRPPDRRRADRIGRFRALEAPDAEVPLPDRLRLHEVILDLWDDGSPFARSCLLGVIDEVRLAYGPWRALKRIFKEAEERGDLEVFAALAARIDAALASGDHEVGRRTLAYLARRAWRHLRRIGRSVPVAYPDAASAVLARYPEGWRGPAAGAWVYNHLLHYTACRSERSAGRGRRSAPRAAPDPIAQRAFPELWRRSPRPLFGLLERARSDAVRRYAADALKADFRSALREVEPAWVVRLIAVESGPVHEFAVWVLANVPRFDQASFREVGLHEPVLRLFDSPSDAARSFASEYARTHASDLPVDALIRLADNRGAAVRALAADLLGGRDPRAEVGLDAWGRLLESDHGHELAAAAIRRHFGPKELTPAWFRDRLFSPSIEAFAFAAGLLPRLHPPESLGAGYFIELLSAFDRAEEEPAGDVAGFAMDHLGRFGPDGLDPEFLGLLLLRPATRRRAAGWIDEGKLKAGSVPIDLLKALAYHPDWESHPLVRRAPAISRRWGEHLGFDEPLADRVLGWLGDVRRFSPADLGFDWLLGLVRRAEPRYHDFAVEVMIKAFVPADFATSGEQGAAGDRGAAGQAEPAGVDFGGASFLFTGKLATMQRKEAEGKVRDAGGAVASGVSAKLHYLVIGDEGSPLYGHGKKGSKQLRAEELNGEGANIRIISETAFLQMLSGRAREASADATLAGCERLWEMAVGGGPEDVRLGQFARKYLRRHHPEMALDETDRPVDPGAEIPADFLGFDRVRPLFSDSREPLRAIALAIARYEFARWSPPAEDLVRLAESPHAEVRRFISGALLADEAPEHRRYRIDPDALSPSAVYRFCESAEEPTRALGLALIGRSPRLRIPDELYSTDREPRPRRPGVRRRGTLGPLSRPARHRWVGALRRAEADDRAGRPQEGGRGGGLARARAPGEARSPAVGRAEPRGPAALDALRAAPRASRPGAVIGGGRGRRRGEAPAALEPPGEARGDRDAPRPGDRGRGVRPGRPAAPGRVPRLPGQERTGRLPGRRHPDPPRPPVPRRGRQAGGAGAGEGGRVVSVAEGFLPYREQIRALASSGKRLLFVTEHPEGRPTALYRLDCESFALDADPMPVGARSLCLVGDDAWIGGPTGRC